MSEVQNMNSTKKSILACWVLIGIIILMVIAYVNRMSSAVSAITDFDMGNISLWTTITIITSIIISSLIFALIHGLGFRIFTIYNKESRPQMSWRMLIQLATFLICAAILWCIEYIFFKTLSIEDLLNSMIFNFSWVMVINILLLVLIDFITMSVVTKILLPIDLITSIKSSILNAIVLLILLSPTIYLYSKLGGIQSEANTKTNNYNKYLEKSANQSNKKISNLTGKNAFEFFSDQKAMELFSQAVGEKNVKDLKNYFIVSSPSTKEGDWIIAEGCMPKACDTDNGIIMVDNDSTKMIVGIYDKDENRTLLLNSMGLQLKQIDGFYTLGTQTPQKLKDWLRQRGSNLRD